MKKTKNLNLWQYKMARCLSYLTIFIIPLYMARGDWAVFNAPKVIFMICSISVISILFIWGRIKDNNSKFTITPVHIALLIFIIVLTVSSILGIAPRHSFFGSWKESISLINIYFLGIFACIIGSLIRQDKVFLKKLLLSSFLSSLIVSLVTYLPDGVMKYPSISSTIGNSSYVGAYLLFNAIFGIGLLFYYKKVWNRILISIGILFIILSPIFFNKFILLGKISLSELIQNPFMILGVANAATLGLGISVLIFILLILIKSNRKFFKVFGLLAFMGLLLGTLHISNLLTNTESNLHHQFVKEKTGNRFLAWDIAKQNFSENPVIGNGFNNFSFAYQEKFTREYYEKGNTFEWFTEPHNVFWGYLSNNGILGLSSYLILLIIVFSSLFIFKKEEENNPYLRLALASIVFGYFVQNLFGFDTITSYTMIFLIVGISIYYSNDKFNFEIFIKNKILLKIINFLLIILFISSIYLFVVLPIKEKKAWASLSSTKNVSEILKKDIQNISLIGNIYDSEYMVSKFIDTYKNNLDKINIENKNIVLGQIDKITQFIEKDIKREPHSMHSYLLVSQLLNIRMIIESKKDNTYVFSEDRYNKEIWNKSKSYLEKAKSMNSENKDTYETLAQLYIIKGDIENAYKYARLFIEIAPELPKTYDLPKQLLKMAPNKDFEKYLNEMESKWVK